MFVLKCLLIEKYPEKQLHNKLFKLYNVAVSFMSNVF